MTKPTNYPDLKKKLLKKLDKKIRLSYKISTRGGISSVHFETLGIKRITDSISKALDQVAEATAEKLEIKKEDLIKPCEEYSNDLDQRICFDDGFCEAVFNQSLKRDKWLKGEND